MKILKGVIESSVDFAKEGLLFVDAGPRLGSVSVFYTSPFGGTFSPKGKAGFFAIPEEGSTILFVKVDGEYFYLSTVHRREVDAVVEDGRNVIKDREEQGPYPTGLYSQATPSRLVMMDRKGNTLRFNHAFDSNNGFSTGIDLISRDKKKLLLNDSPNCYGIYLQNEEGDGITIASKYKEGYTPGPKIAPREISVNTYGKVTVTSRKSSIRMLVKDGQDINIRNESVGAMNLTPTPQYASPVGVTEPYGNIRISSDVRDLYMTAGEGHRFTTTTQGQAAWSPAIHRSRIIVRAIGDEGLVQLSSDGSLIIRAPKGRVYIHGASINIKADQDVNMNANGNINIAAGGTIKMSSNLTALGAVDATRPTSFASDLAEQDHDGRIYGTTINDAPNPTTFGHIELSDGVIINGLRIDLAPIQPPSRARRAIHPLWELSDYETFNPSE